MKALFGLTCMVFALLLWGFYIWSTPGLRPVTVSIYKPPIVSVENRIHDLGSLMTDSHAETTFLIFNVGGKHLRIQNVETSCGCTVASISKKVLRPGGFTKINIKLDTALKIGPIRKKVTLFSNDPKRPELALFVTGTVKPKPMATHDSITINPQDRLALFKGDCATCHVDAGKGKTGKPLFLSDCAMCHGSNAQGNQHAGPSLLTFNSETEAVKTHLFDRIANGSPHSPQMPPFSKKQGGPLSEDEIHSLVQFLLYQNQQNASGLLNSADEEQENDNAAFENAKRHPH